MTYERKTIGEEHAGCWLDNHRGHYITRDMIDLATGFGFIIDPFAEFALRVYEDYDGDENFPHESLTDLADEALRWLNYGDNEGVDRTWQGQNSPPIIPEGYAWDWWEGDFGLYRIEDLTD
jgi:hypothetical protein